MLAATGVAAVEIGFHNIAAADGWLIGSVVVAAAVVVVREITSVAVAASIADTASWQALVAVAWSMVVTMVV